MVLNSIELLIQKINELISQFQKQQDHTHEQKLKQLQQKLEQHELTIALCGHFSAGKSTLINTLCGAKLLPSSPIPTSANIVSLQYGEEAVAKVEIASENEVRQETVQIDQLSTYCIDGEKYSSVHIYYPSPFLKQGIQLLDTPGIDSTDDAHRLSTESALHLADVVFYVMDYNHVQSEINFTFAKQLKEWGKPLYFIVNQIDKHRDTELSFESYRQSVWDAFLAWNLEPAGIVYLSLKKPEHPEHQWEQLLNLSADLVHIKDELKVESVKASLQQVMNEHIDFYAEQLDIELDKKLSAYGGMQKVEAELTRLVELKLEYETLQADKDKIVPSFRDELDTILKNATITPASLRDKIALFLESRQAGFKQGFLFTKSKTEQEQQHRLDSVYAELKELVQSQLVWHIQELLRRLLKSFKLDSQVIEKNVLKLDEVFPSSDWLISQISSGAVFGPQYTLTYSAAIADAIKRIFKDKCISIVESIVEGELAEQFAQPLASLKENIKALQTSIDGLSIYNDFKQKLNHYRQMLLEEIKTLTQSNNLKLPTVQSVQSSTIDMVSFVETEGEINLSQSEQAGDEIGIENIKQLMKRYDEVKHKLVQDVKKLSQMDHLSHFKRRLEQKIKRLEQKQFTISLFGAFSAGKSSLANALIGDAVLPVSPNPTTAAINSILPPSEKHPHNTASIYLKTEQMMIDDLVYALRLLGYSVKADLSIQSIFIIIDKIEPHHVTNTGRAHYSFIKAARKGWIKERAHLGTAIDVDRDTYVLYVADESRSCFVQEIKFYYDCALTASGIVLVDTPGADSVNARHTGVSFNYIKNTDAIIFVTYYNHAFSNADRQFLDQLGRVKEQFELDKMFFIVNAADLASSESELQGVLQHVENNLANHQIKQPKLFPVSSIFALEAKQREDHDQLIRSGMKAFEHQFYSFIQHDLAEMVISLALQERDAIVREVQHIVSKAKQERLNKEAIIHKLDHVKQGIGHYFETKRQERLLESLHKEIHELTFYIIQRLQLRFTDFYNLAINPASIKDEGVSATHALYTAWLELERSLATELNQELLATTMRVEKYIHKLIAQQAEDISTWIIKEKLDYKWGNSMPSLSQPEEQRNWELPDIDSKWLKGYFKSAKHFFEQKGKSQMRLSLEPLIFSSMKDWMSDVTEEWKQFYASQYSHAYNETINAIQSQINTQIEQSIQLLHDEQFMHSLEGIVAQLNE